MNKKVLISLLAALAVVVVSVIVLVALQCDHDWASATCTKAETCTLCGETKGSAAGHTWVEATCTEPKTCSACKITEGDALGHNWQGGSCTESAICSVCGGASESTVAHSWVEADCDTPKTCSVCGTAEGEALGHDFAEANCQSPETCKVCGLTRGDTAGHIWDEATCKAPKTCQICKLTEGETSDHNWQDATCKAPKTCSDCGLTEGTATDHNWQSATCKAPKTCSDCGLTEGIAADHQWQKTDCEVPTTCITCGETSGSATEHNWVEATCITPKTCTVCGKVDGTALGHNFASTDGGEKVCTVCNETMKNKCVALTIDDGPSGAITQRLLEGLEARGAKATFFICGYRIDTFPSYPQLILDYGHEIGLHTDNHATLTKLDYNGIYKELHDMYSMLPDDYNVRLMRPPGGAYNETVKQVCKDLGLSVMLWSLDTKDWQTNDVDAIVQRIINGAQNGSVILMHDLKSSSVEAALKAVDALQAMGYEFVTVSELAAIQGKPLEPGQVYTSIS